MYEELRKDVLDVVELQVIFQREMVLAFDLESDRFNTGLKKTRSALVYTLGNLKEPIL
jgi:hypothetical protein